MPETSIVLPTYNRYHSLKQAVKTVFTQQYNDFELIIVDDGSTDSTREYLRAQGDPRIQVHMLEKNRGGCVARNTGIHHARGEYIAFLDDDDRWDPAKLQKQLRHLHKTGAHFCYTGKKVIDTHCICGTGYSFKNPKFSDLHKSIMWDNFIGSTSSSVIKKEALLAAGGFDPDLPALQDYDLYIRLIKAGCTITSINEPLVIYYKQKSGKNISASYAKFRAALTHLHAKYADDPYAALFRRGNFYIGLKRCFHSHWFVLDALCYYACKPFNKKKTVNTI